MSIIGSAFLWVIDKAGSKQIDNWLESESSQTIRTLQRALLESQDKRIELEDLDAILRVVSKQRDAFQALALKLGIENSDLKAEIDRLKALLA